jgi:predicted ABC-class ATPase
MKAGQRRSGIDSVPEGEGLRRILRSIDREPFPAYRRIVGRHDLGEFVVHVDRVPPDPFAGTARVRLSVSRSKTGLPASWIRTAAGRVGVEDYVARAAQAALAGQTAGSSDAPGTGQVSLEPPGRAIVPRSTCRIDDASIELRLFVDLPSHARRVRGEEAATLFFTRLARLATATLLFAKRSLDEARKHLEAAEDHEALQRDLRSRGFVAFVPNGAFLAGRRGEPFVSPPSLEVSFALPHRGTVRGMAIPAGVTVIAGGFGHGKSTLVEALAAGIRPHPPGDGREGISIVPDAVVVRSEPGRVVHRVDVSPLLGTLPSGRSTSDFSSEAADTVTSQAAAIAEAIEIGARVLLLDEDASAASLFARDARMRALVPPSEEPVVPFADRARDLYDGLGVSSILATGSSGDALAAAHTVVRMASHRAIDATGRAREIAGAPREGGRGAGTPFSRAARRSPSLPDRDAPLKTGLHGAHGIRIGHETIDLSALSQISETGEVRAIAELLREAAPRMGATIALDALVGALERLLEDGGLDALDRPAAYNLSRPRPFEIAAALCRWRSLKMTRLDRNHRPPTGS